MDEVQINGLRVRTEVGFSPHELGKLQELNITIHLRTSIKKAGESDRVEDTINYKTITKEVLFHVENKKYNLIEAVATDVARICVVRHGVPSVKVIVSKPNALRFSNSSSVNIGRRWEDFDWYEAHISIGSNIQPQTNLPLAINLLKEKTELVKLSQAFKTTPVGFKEQEEFVNMAAVVRTKLDLAGLKQVLTQLEHKLGRVRNPNNKNAPRTIDLDISFWGNMTCEYKLDDGCAVKSWSIPDPDTCKHAHVIIPLADVTPEFIHPSAKKTLKVIATEVCGKTDFWSFFPVSQVCLANEIRSNGVENGMILPGALKSKGSTVKIPFAHVTHLNGCSEQAYSPVALITGAAKRLGACIAKRLHETGYNVLVHYNTSVTEATDLVKQMNSVRSNSARQIQGDLKHDTQKTSQRIIDESLKAWGRLDLLVNNASQFQPTEVGKITQEDWNGLMETNLSAPFFLSQAAFPSLKTSRGCIINLVDIHGDRPLNNHSVYCISKAGLRMCTMALAKEFAPFVRVNGVSPGAILWPEQWKGVTVETKKAEILKKIPLSRRGEPGDIAEAVQFLACSAGYITGQVINVDGGRSLNQ
ncbi:uncharacterized protein LOC144639168 isoform X3 [Oculina patagonica]